MNITKRKDGRCQGSVQVNGKRKFFYGSTKKEVKRKYEMWNGTENSQNSTVSASISRWLDKSASRYSNATQEQYRYITRYIFPIIGALRVEEVLPVNCQDVLDAAHRKGLSKSTIKHIKKVMHVFFEHERKMTRTIKTNPCVDLIVKGKATRARRAPTPEELVEIWKKLKSTQYENAYKVLALTGMRPSEACGLKWSDVDDQINISEARTRYDVSQGKTKNAKRSIPLTSTVKVILNYQRVFLNENKIVSDYIFPNKYGSPSNAGNLSTEWTRKNMPVTMYELRHLFVSMAIDKMPMKELQQLIGHSSSMDTSGTYAHVFGENKNAAILEEINAALNLSDVKSDVKSKNQEKKPKAL